MISIPKKKEKKEKKRKKKENTCRVQKNPSKIVNEFICAPQPTKPPPPSLPINDQRFGAVLPFTAHVKFTFRVSRAGWLAGRVRRGARKRAGQARTRQDKRRLRAGIRSVQVEKVQRGSSKWQLFRNQLPTLGLLQHHQAKASPRGRGVARCVCFALRYLWRTLYPPPSPFPPGEKKYFLGHLPRVD